VYYGNSRGSRNSAKDGLTSGFVHPTLLKFIERLPSLVENDLLLSDSLIPAYDHIDIQRIELDAATDSARFLAGDQRRPGPPNGSRMMSSRCERSTNASCNIAVGFTVGCSCRPWRASDPSDDAPGYVHTFER
jgi:hypothetical protein